MITHKKGKKHKLVNLGPLVKHGFCTLANTFDTNCSTKPRLTIYVHTGFYSIIHTEFLCYF